MVHGTMILRFLPQVRSTATTLGDVLLIDNDENHWGLRPLKSHPRPGEFITKAQIIHWMRDQGVPFEWTWEGITQIQVKKTQRTSGDLLLEKAKKALLQDLTPHYARVELKPLSHPKDSEYSQAQFKIERRVIPYPAPKRLSVRLSAQKHPLLLWFAVRAEQRVLVAKNALPSHTPIKKGSFNWQMRDIAGLKSKPASHSPSSMWLKIPLPKDSILLAKDLMAIPLVIHGQTVHVSLAQNSIRVIMEAVAQTDGALGQTVRVQNPLNKAVFSARVTGAQRAEVIS